MGRPLEKSDCDELGAYIHRRNIVCSHNLLERLVTAHAPSELDNLPPAVFPTVEPKEPPRNSEPDWWPTMWFGDLVTAQGPRLQGSPTINSIQLVVAKSFNLTKLDLISQRRTQNVVLPRQIAMYLAKMLTPRSYPEIGRRFGGRDHTTEIHAVHKIGARCVSDPAFAMTIKALKAEIVA